MMISYKLQKDINGKTNSVTIIGTAISIPFDKNNSDYVEYLKWLEEGNTPLPAETE